MDPQNQKETGKFGDVTEALTDSDAGQPVDNTDENAGADTTVTETEKKTEVTVDDNATEAASVETVNTTQVHSDSSAGDASVNVTTGLREGETPPTPQR